MMREMEELGLGKFVEDKSRCGFIKMYPLDEKVLQTYELNEKRFEEICKGVIAGDRCSEAMRKWLRSRGGDAIETSLGMLREPVSPKCAGKTKRSRQGQDSTKSKRRGATRKTAPESQQ